MGIGNRSRAVFLTFSLTAGTTMKSLAGALIGAALGIGLLVALGMYMPVNSLWPVLVVGVLCGVAMRIIAKGPGGAYIKGGLAALAVLAAVIGGNLALATALQKEGNKSVEKRPASSIAEIESAEVVEDGDDAPAEEAGELVIASSKNNGFLGDVAISAEKKDFSMLDAIWLSVGALIAYELGKGAASQPVEVAAEEANKEDEEPTNA
jgi:hypothetical protein